MTLALPNLPGITWPVDKSVGQFDTTVQVSVSGKENRHINRVQPRYTYTIQIAALDSNGTNAGLIYNSMQTLVGFFNQCFGRALMFQYVDPDDNSVSNQPFGIGDGTTTSFQLCRTLGSFTDSVFAPVGAPQIYTNGSLLSAGVDYTLNTMTGVVTFSTAPAAGASLTWSGTYAWWCSWDNDALDVSNFASGLYEMKKASFSTKVL
jgi:uncharacterized protein (TIGR02217 family)